MSNEMWSQVKEYEDGDSLNAEVLNVPVGQLADRTSYLYNRLRGLSASDTMSAVILTDVSLSTETGKEPAVGNVVYLDQKSQKFACAKAVMSLYDDFTADNSAFTVGILKRKEGAVGDVLVYGRLVLNPGGDPFRRAAMIESGEAFRAGRYYLSANEAGKLTAHPNGPLIYVCTIGAEEDMTGGFSGIAIVNPQFLDIGTSHVHRTAVLKARPAGEVDAGGHVIGYGTISDGPFHLVFGGTWTGKADVLTYQFKLAENETSPSGYTLTWKEGAEAEFGHEVDIEAPGDAVLLSNGLEATLFADAYSGQLQDEQKTWAAMSFPEAARGWVDHVPGDGDDEPSAKYDYVVGMDPAVSKYWPPVPPKSAALMVNGVEMDNKVLFPARPTVSFGRYAIHWFEDDAGRKPWPEDIEEANLDPAKDKTMTMHWVRGFQGATGPVTSIQPKPGSPLKVYGYGTRSPANVGDLEIDVDMEFDMEDGGAPGFVVPKRVVNGKMVAGPVVERLIAGPGISVLPTSGSPAGQGTVIVALDDGAYRNQFSDLALENAEQAKIGMFPYIRLKGYVNSITSPSAFTATMRVPMNLPDTSYSLSLIASVFGEQGFSDASTRSACIKLLYNILPDFTAEGSDKYRNLKTSLIAPDGERTVLIPFGHQDGTGITYNGFDPVYVTTYGAAGSSSSDVVEGVLGGDIPYPPEFIRQTTVAPELRPGYLVGIRISRAVTDAMGVVPYTGALGFINLSWVLSASAE